MTSAKDGEDTQCQDRDGDDADDRGGRDLARSTEPVLAHDGGIPAKGPQEGQDGEQQHGVECLREKENGDERRPREEHQGGRDEHAGVQLPRDRLIR